MKSKDSSPHLLPSTPAVPAGTDTNGGTGHGTDRTQELRITLADLLQIKIGCVFSKEELFVVAESILFQHSHRLKLEALTFVIHSVLQQTCQKLKKYHQSLEKRKHKSGRVTLTLGEWIALHSFLQVDTQSKYKQDALYKIDKIITHYDHLIQLIK
jgi:hypothetical protein